MRATVCVDGVHRTCVHAVRFVDGRGWMIFTTNRLSWWPSAGREWRW